MRLTDQRLGEVLGRRDHRGRLPEVNPVLWGLLNELDATGGRHAEEVVDATLFLIDLIGANEPGGPRVGLHTAIRVLTEVERTGGRDAYDYLTKATGDDALLRMCVDALLAYSERWRRARTRGEREAVAVALSMLLKMVCDEAEVNELERALAG